MAAGGTLPRTDNSQLPQRTPYTPQVVVGSASGYIYALAGSTGEGRGWGSGQGRKHGLQTPLGSVSSGPSRRHVLRCGRPCWRVRCIYVVALPTAPLEDKVTWLTPSPPP